MAAPGPPSEPSPKLAGEPTAEDLRELVRLLDLVPIPDDLMPRVLANVRSYRAAMRRFAESGLDVADVVTAQPYRAALTPGIDPATGSGQIGGRR